MRVTLEQAVERFLRDREVAGYKPNTILSNKHDLSKFLQAVDPTVDVSRFGREHVSRALEYAIAKGNKNSTINTMMAAIGAFAKWCRDEGLIPPDRNPMAGRRQRPVQPRQYDTIHLSDFPEVLRIAGEQHPRDRAYIALALYTMLRQSEICSLRVRDLDLRSNLLHVVIHKTSDQDSMKVVPELRVEMRNWLTYYAENYGPLQDDWYLVPTMKSGGFLRKGNEFTRMPDKLAPHRPMILPHKILHKVLTTMGWDVKGRHIGSHTLRRSASRAAYDELVNQGVDDALRKTGAWLHHRSILMTERYLQISADRERRNLAYEDAPLYPSLQADNVTPLRSVDGEANAAGM